MGSKAISAPHKKTKNKDLTTEQKTENRKRAQKSIVVEHIIRRFNFFSSSCGKISAKLRKLRTNIFNSMWISEVANRCDSSDQLK